MVGKYVFDFGDGTELLSIGRLISSEPLKPCFVELREPMVTLRNFNATLLHQYPIPIDSQMIMRADLRSIFRGQDIWCRGVICRAMNAGKAGRGKAMSRIQGLDLGAEIACFWFLSTA